MSKSNNVTSSSDDKAVLTGCVKWFDNKRNYGFATVLTEGENHNQDIFIHQSNIKTKQDCFRTLYVGECINFQIAKSDNPTHPFHAVNITGFNGGLLHCENPSFRRPHSAGRDDNVRGNGNGAGNGFRGGSSGRGRSEFQGRSYNGDRQFNSFAPRRLNNDRREQVTQQSAPVSDSVPPTIPPTIPEVEVSAPAVVSTPEVSEPAKVAPKGKGRSKKTTETA